MLGNYLLNNCFSHYYVCGSFPSKFRTKTKFYYFLTSGILIWNVLYFLNILNFLHLKTVTLKFANFNDHFCGWNIEPNDIDQNVPDHLYIKFVNILDTLSTCNIEIIIKMYLLFFSFNLGAVHELRNAILDIFRL